MSKDHEVVEVVEKIQAASLPSKDMLVVTAFPYSHFTKKELPKEKSFAEMVDECAKFYALYGLLDGISVSYSTLKYLCEIISHSSSEYKELLNTLLTDPISLLFVILSSASIAGLSSFANYLEKYKPGPTNNAVEKLWNDCCVQAKKYNVESTWDYIRNIFKGTKNGFKGAKGFVALFLALEVLTKNTYKSITFLIGMTVSIVCAVNRCWNISMNNQRKKLSKSCQVSIDKVSKLNDFLEKKQDLKKEIRALQSRLNGLSQLNQKALDLGLQSFELDDLSKCQKLSNRPVGGAQSLPNLNEQNKLIEQRNQLLLSPEINNQKEIIGALKKAISNNDLIGEYHKIKHPLVERLNREIKRLIDLQKTTNENEIYTVTTLTEKIRQKKETLKNTIFDQKQHDRYIFNHWLNSSDSSKDALDKLNMIIGSIDTSQLVQYQNSKVEFEKSFKELFSKLKQSRERLDKQSAQAKDNEKALELEVAAYEQCLYELFDRYKLSKSFRAKLILKELNDNKLHLEEFLTDKSLQLLISNIIAGIVDAPYLYVGIMSIVIIKSLPLLLFLTLSVIAFTVVSVLFRAYEEIDKTKKVTVQLLKAYIIECDNQWKVDQNNYYKAYANFKFKNNIQNIDGTVYSEKFREGSKGAISKLIDSYNQSQKSRLELKSLISPSYYSALMYGAKDALSMFGAIASIFYAVNIILLLTGSTFPPVLIVSAVSLGLVSLISFISFRLYCTYRIRSKLETYFQPRVIETSEKEFKHDIPSCTLGWSDCNTDGLTKGELFFQEINEIFRSVCSGVGKSNNLIDFFFSHYKEHSQEGSEELPLLLTISLICLAVIYGGVLALRAFSKGFKSFAKNNKQCTLESKEEPVEKKEYKIEPDILAEKKLACVDNNEILMLEADKVSFSSYSFFNGGNDEEICPEDEARYCHSPKIFSNFNPEGEGDNIAEDSLTI